MVNLPQLSPDKFYQAFLSLIFWGKGSYSARGRPGNEAMQLAENSSNSFSVMAFTFVRNGFYVRCSKGPLL